MNTVLHFTSFLLISLGAAAVAWANSSNPPNGVTGAPGEPTCAQAGCHDQYSLNSGPGAAELPAELAWYSSVGTCPPETSLFPVRVRQPGATRWGFQLTVVDAAGEPVGTMHLVDSARTEIAAVVRDYVFHTKAGTDAGIPDSSNVWEVGWAFDWASFTYPLKAYLAGVAADNDGTPQGDYVYTYSAPVSIIIVDWFCDNPGDINQDYKITSADVIFLVNFIFKSGVHPPGGDIAADMDCSGAVAAADIIRLVNHVFRGAAGPCYTCFQCCPQSASSWSCP